MECPSLERHQKGAETATGVPIHRHISRESRDVTNISIGIEGSESLEAEEETSQDSLKMNIYWTTGFTL